jgi:4-hydroxy-tetrahydrodipicolinate synthase
MNHRFKGTGVALVTPFQKDGAIDFDGLTRLVKLQIAGGTDFLGRTRYYRRITST